MNPQQIGSVLKPYKFAKLLKKDFPHGVAVGCFQAFFLKKIYNLTPSQLYTSLSSWPEANIFKQLSPAEVDNTISELPRFEDLLSSEDTQASLVRELEKQLKNAKPELNPANNPLFDLPYRLTLVTGPSRCGSMWTYNVARELIRASGRTPIPEEAQQDNMEENIANIKSALDSPKSGELTIIKTHALITDIPLAKFILPKRDIRDSLVSLMRFMEIDLQYSMGIMADQYTKQEAYSTVADEKKLYLEFSNIINSPVDTIARIAMFLGFNVSENIRDEIATKFSKQNVKKLIEQVDNKIKEKIKNKETVNDNEVVTFSDGKYRAFDTKTGFQTGHVSDYQEGDWKKILTPEQQQLVNAQLSRFFDTEKTD